MPGSRARGLPSDGTATSSGAVDRAIPAALLATAAVGWWWSVRMAADMDGMAGSMGAMATSASMSLTMGAFVIAWVAMMAAMMFPAISPMVRLYARASQQGSVAPVPFFVSGYLLVWTAVGVPSYFAWRGLDGPLSEGSAWVGRLAGVVFLAAAVYQLTPLKQACLKQCRSPISFFIQHARATTDTPLRAARLGAHHGLFCLGCCWAIMAILVAVGTMHLAWMAVLTALIYAEKVLPRGRHVVAVAAAAFGVMGAVLLVAPTAITTIT